MGSRFPTCCKHTGGALYVVFFAQSKSFTNTCSLLRAGVNFLACFCLLENITYPVIRVFS